MATFVKDVEEIRNRATRKIEDGPVTAGYKIDKDRAIEILNEALATEYVCVLRYMHHYFMATGVHGKAVAQEFKQHADDEREHADEIAERIQQLGGKPDLNPGTLVQRSVSQYIEGETLADMIKEDLIAERMVIEVYQEMIRFFGDGDPTTRRILEHILGEEEEHAADLSDLLFVVDPHTGEAEGRDPGTTPLELKSKNERKGMGSEAEDALSSASYGGDAGIASSRGQGQRSRTLDVHPTPREQGGHTQPGEAKTGREGTSKEGAGNMARSQAKGKSGDKREEPEPFAGRGTVQAPASNIGGVSGRPMNRRGEKDDIDLDEIADHEDAGASSGTNRTPKILQKNRKSRRAA